MEVELGMEVELLRIEVELLRMEVELGKRHHHLRLAAWKLHHL